jgi:hypothetical protein
MSYPEISHKKKSPKVFVSYKWENEEHKTWVKQLAGDLRAFGIDAQLDVWEVKYGDSFTDFMIKAINDSDVVLLIMTPKTVEAAEAEKGQGGALKFEVQLATARRISGDKFRFIGVLRKGDKITAHLKDFRNVDFRDDERYHETLQKLVADLFGFDEKPELGDRSLQPQSAPTPTSNDKISDDLSVDDRVQNDLFGFDEKPKLDEQNLQPPSEPAPTSNNYIADDLTVDDRARVVKEYKGGSVNRFIIEGIGYAVLPSIALFSGYLIQTEKMSFRELLSLSIPVPFSVFFFMCYALRFRSDLMQVVTKGGNIKTILFTEAIYIFPIIGILYSVAAVAAYFALGTDPLPLNLIYAFAIYSVLFIGYGIFLLRFRRTGDRSIRHQLVWSALLSYAVNLYYGLEFSNLKFSAVPIIPLVALILLFAIIELFQFRLRTQGTIICILCVGIILIKILNPLNSLLDTFFSLFFCVCIAEYLVVFEAWEVTSDLSKEVELRESEWSTFLYVENIGKILAFSVTTSAVLILTACILPLFFIFSSYGFVFLIIFAVHVIFAIMFWFYFGYDLEKLRNLPRTPIKIIAGTTFLVGLLIASFFNVQPNGSVLNGAATWSFLGIGMTIGQFPITKLFREIRNESFSFSRIFRKRINWIRLWCVVSMISSITVVLLSEFYEYSSVFRYKADFAVVVYFIFLILGLIIELFEDFRRVPVRNPYFDRHKQNR